MPFRGVSIKDKGGLEAHLTEHHINVQLAINLLQTITDDAEIARVLTMERRTRLTAENAPAKWMRKIQAVTVRGWRPYLPERKYE